MTLGRNISHYELAEKLGEGGMGVVYKAWDLTLDRPVALKFLPGHMADSLEQVTRFRQEARAISAVNHPNIATIYEIGEAEGHCFLALEYLPGGTLDAALQHLKSVGQQLSVEQALDYAVQISEALAHAHAHGVIHRDIKAANMLFTENGALKITDFGLAKLAEGVSVTQTGIVMGTPAAMSPEQAQGLEVDERSDIFSAGVVLFELFTNQRPFRGGSSTAVLYQVVNEPVPPLGAFRPGTPIALERIVAKALEKDRAARYQKAADLAADLRGLRRELLSGSFTGRSVQETVATTPVPSRRRLWLAVGLSAAFIVAGMGAWIGWPALRDRAESAMGLHARSFPGPKRLAVLPFRNVGGSANDQAFVDGLREMVISKLTRLEQPGGSLLVVVSPDEVQAKEISSAADAARRLGANLVMTGSVVQAGQPQLIVNLEDPQSLTVLRSETIDASHPDLMVEATKLVRLLELEMNAGTRRDLEVGGSSNPAATRFYLEGRGYLLRFDRVENLDLAIGAFRDAVAKDANYALAWAALAEALGQKYKVLKEPALLAEAADHIAHGLQLNSRLAAVHITMGQIRRIQGDDEAALRELQEALKLEPANAAAFRELGNVYQAIHRDDEAETIYQKAIETRPGDAAAHVSLGRFYYNRERFPAAELSFRRAIELTPDSYLAHSNLGAVYFKMQRYQEMAEQLEKSASIAPSARAYNNLGTAYYYQKRYADAVFQFQHARDSAPNNSTYWGGLADAYRWTPALRDQAPAAYRRAIELLEKDIHQNPRDPLLHARLATYLVSINDRQRTLEEIAAALRLDSKLAYVQYHAALVYEQLGDRERALKAIGEALKAGQNLAEVLAAPPLERLCKDPRFARMASEKL